MCDFLAKPSEDNASGWLRNRLADAWGAMYKEVKRALSLPQTSVGSVHFDVFEPSLLNAFHNDVFDACCREGAEKPDC